MLITNFNLIYYLILLFNEDLNELLYIPLIRNIKSDYLGNTIYFFD